MILLVVLICTLAGWLVGYPLIGLGVGVLLLGAFTWANYSDPFR